jgi:putative chitinase
MPLSAKQLEAAMPKLRGSPKVAAYLPHLNAALRERSITTPRRLWAWLATMGHESVDLTRLEENLNYSATRMREVWPARFRGRVGVARSNQLAHNPEALANFVYANRMGNGPESSGDGWRFRGRTPTHLTGRENYREAGRALGVDLEGDPDRANDPDVMFRVACWFWHSRNLNALADKGDMRAITKRVNGGYNGLTDRLARYDRAKRAIRDTAATGPSAALRPLAAEAGADSGSSPLESAPVPVVDAVPVVEVAAVAAAPEPVPGGGPDDPTVRVTAKKSTIAGEMVAGITGIATLASGHIQTLTGMPPDVQKIVVIIAAALLALWFIGGLISRWQTREIHANAGKRNVV